MESIASDGSQNSHERSHLLQVDRIELVGGGRSVSFQSGLNFIRGDITTGKTTLVRLLRGLIGNIPTSLPPETAEVRALSGEVVLGSRIWEIYRPTVTTVTAPVEVAQKDSTDGVALRLTATGSGGYGEFVLKELALPVVYVPRARQEPTTELTPVTINDWLNYCVVPGDELDVQVFGHRETFRDLKRKWVFEIAYGLYDETLAQLVADSRRVQAEIRATEAESEVVKQFLASSEFGSKQDLEIELVTQEQRRAELREQQSSVRTMEFDPAGEIAELREGLLYSRAELDEINHQIRDEQSQIRNLKDLDRQLAGQSKRLTRAIVADEWMVDFDFLVCPRCGHDVDQHRTHAPICYLCEQPEPDTLPSRDSLLREQDRVSFQINETQQLLQDREASSRVLQEMRHALGNQLDQLSMQLDAATAEFVSTQASVLKSVAAKSAEVDANVRWIQRALTLFEHEETREARLTELRAQLDRLEVEIAEHRTGISAAEENIVALERRMLNYLERLHVPTISDLLTVRINRTTYLPEVSARTFDELSSQGLKTLVNVAHALAHHTVAIDRRLNMPGLLVLDGVSANSGKEGLDGNRILDMYRLFAEVSEEYRDRLQLIVVDNEMPQEIVLEHGDRIALTLSQSDRLIGHST